MKLVAAVLYSALFGITTTVDAQQAKYKMITDIPTSIISPDSLTTSLGTLRFFDGFPGSATVRKVYDNLDFQRGVQAYLIALPVACFYGLRSDMQTFGPDNKTMLITETLMDSRSLMLPSNTETVYNMARLNATDGPLVIDLPPKTLGFIQDFCGRFVTDMGNVGPDNGNGGKYLLLPPGYSGTMPEGYFILHSRTFGNFLFIRGFLVNGDPKPAVENTKKNFRIHPLARAANPPPMNFVNVSGKNYNTIGSNHVSLYYLVAQVLQEEPLDAVDSETRGLLVSIGIRKGKPFEPDARMKNILTDAAAIGNAIARTLTFSTRERDTYYYPGSAWKAGFAGNDPEFSPGGVLDIDAKTQMFYLAWGLTPAMIRKIIGFGSQYAYAERDAGGQYLNDAKVYHLHLPQGIPVKNFWSLIIDDPQTRSMLQTDQQFPSVSSLKKGIIINPDSSVDIYFGPAAPQGKEANWIQTIPGKGWFIMLRLYGPLEPWFDKTWRPGEIELTKRNTFYLSQIKNLYENT